MNCTVTTYAGGFKIILLPANEFEKSMLKDSNMENVNSCRVVSTASHVGLGAPKNYQLEIEHDNTVKAAEDRPDEVRHIKGGGTYDAVGSLRGSNYISGPLLL